MRYPLIVFMFLIAMTPLSAQRAECELPTLEWHTEAPEMLGLDSTMLEAGETAIEEDLPFLRSVIVVRHGCIAYERYFASADAETLFNSLSVTKSVTATLIGMGLEEGTIDSVNESIGHYLDIPNNNPRYRITISHLLHMLSGLGWDENRLDHILGMLELERDELGFILSLPLEYRPGVRWNYSTADSHLLSTILTAAVGESALAYATPRLFEPLGITDVEWTTDSSGVNLGGTQLFWRARDMAKFGLLYLQNGAWGDQQLVSPDWIAFETDPQLADPSDYELSYAAHWWHVILGDYPPMYAASGYGGQLILVAPEQDMVIVTTANSYTHFPDGYISGSEAEQQHAAILDYIEQFILPAVLT